MEGYGQFAYTAAKSEKVDYNACIQCINIMLRVVGYRKTK